MALSDGWGHDGVSYNGKEMRELVETLTGSLSGVTGGTNAMKVSQQTTAAATVKVAEGGAVIPATGAGLGGSYQVYNDADLTSPSIAATSANGRKDRLIIRVTNGVPALEVVQGVEAGSPTEPSITGDNYMELALITLPASTTNITDAMITDRRVRLAAGSPVVSSATRPSSPHEGQRIYETDTDKRLVYDGSAWTLPKNSAGGALHYQERTTDIGPATFATVTDLDSSLLVVNFTLASTRRVRITGYVRSVSASVANARVILQIRRASDGVVMEEQVVAGHSTVNVGGRGGQVVWSPLLTAGTYSYKLSGLAADSANFTFAAASTYPVWVLAEDIGGI